MLVRAKTCNDAWPRLHRSCFHCFITNCCAKYYFIIPKKNKTMSISGRTGMPQKNASNFKFKFLHFPLKNSISVYYDTRNPNAIYI